MGVGALYFFFFLPLEGREVVSESNNGFGKECHVCFEGDKSRMGS